MLLPLAHAGHWLAELMYVMPVLAIVVWISIKAIIDRRAERRDEPEPR
jgi:uncharacterized membrane protein YoaK (UPF0700 family)